MLFGGHVNSHWWPAKRVHSVACSLNTCPNRFGDEGVKEAERRGEGKARQTSHHLLSHLHTFTVADCPTRLLREGTNR